jgi:hypothetical protein
VRLRRFLEADPLADPDFTLPYLRRHLGFRVFVGVAYSGDEPTGYMVGELTGRCLMSLYGEYWGRDRTALVRGYQAMFEWARARGATHAMHYTERSPRAWARRAGWELIGDTYIKDVTADGR